MESGWDGRSVKISYDKYPSLPNLLLELLDADFTGLRVADSVFPALEIIRRAGPPGVGRDKIKKHITTHLGSEVYHIREMSAHSFCSLVLNEDLTDVIHYLLEFPQCENARHGSLLAIRYILERHLILNPAQIIGEKTRLFKFNYILESLPCSSCFT
jgi:hypothetical protein